MRPRDFELFREKMFIVENPFYFIFHFSHQDGLESCKNMRAIVTTSR